jgi:hypothetical protein
MKQSTVEALDALFQRHPVLAAGPASGGDMDAVERYAGFALPAEYRQFVHRYGSAIVGPYAVYGVGRSEAMGMNETSVVEVTERFRSKDWPGTQDALVVAIDHTGNAFTIESDGRVRRYDHNSGQSEDVASSFEEFVLKIHAMIR